MKPITKNQKENPVALTWGVSAKMKKVQLSGIIRFEENKSFPQIKLIQEGGYKIDLVSRFIEIDESFPKSKIQVNYWLSEEPCTKNEMLENTLRRLFGDINA